MAIDGELGLGDADFDGALLAALGDLDLGRAFGPPDEAVAGGDLDDARLGTADADRRAAGRDDAEVGDFAHQEGQRLRIDLQPGDAGDGGHREALLGLRPVAEAGRQRAVADAVAPQARAMDRGQVGRADLGLQLRRLQERIMPAVRADRVDPQAAGAAGRPTGAGSMPISSDLSSILATLTLAAASAT